MKYMKKAVNPIYIYSRLEQLKKDKFFIAYQKVTILLLLFGVLSFLVKTPIFQKIPFYIFGIWALMFLFFVIKVTIKSLDIKLNKKTCVFMMFIVMICFGIYVVEMINTKRVYTWDQCCYYNNQIDLLNGFNQSFIKGIGKIIKTTYNSDYGYFLLSFTTLIFSFTSKTEKAFILTYAVVEILPVIFVLLLNIINIGQKFNIKNKKIFIISSSIVILTFPLLHRAALWGQPDIFGLFWIGLIVLITTNYKFENIDIRKWTLIILFSFLLAITRRWYIFG